MLKFITVKLEKEKEQVLRILRRFQEKANLSKKNMAAQFRFAKCK